jgi:hypothetical protein
MINSTLLVSTLLVVVACGKVAAKQPRLFTDDELATLETRVLAEVNKSRRDCIRPEALALWKPTGELAACMKECDVLDFGADHRKQIRPDAYWRITTPEAGAVDAKCGALVSAAFERAAATPGCSPFQLGIENDDVIESLHRFHLLHLLVRHAQAQGDRASSTRTLVAALQATQDYARGRVSDAMVALALETSLADKATELLGDAQLTRSDLDALATSVDHLIASEPPPHELLQAEAANTGFAYGLVPLKGPSWSVPGGRTDLMRRWSLRPSTSHDPRDDAGIMMLYAVESGERFSAACPPTASVRECFDRLNASPHTTAAPSADLLDRPRKGDDATRARVKREIVDAKFANNADAFWLVRRAVAIVPLVALRLRIEVLRNGRCPTGAELDVPPYSTLRAPSILGDSIPVTPIDHALRIDPPAWVQEQVECKDRKPPLPPCPPPRIISIPCP